jgi:hypothetical protein
VTQRQHAEDIKLHRYLELRRTIIYSILPLSKTLFMDLCLFVGRAGEMHRAQAVCAEFSHKEENGSDRSAMAKTISNYSVVSPCALSEVCCTRSAPPCCSTFCTLEAHESATPGRIPLQQMFMFPEPEN